MPVRYLIVDDEEPGRRNLRLAMAVHPGWVLAFECDSAAGAREAMAGGGIDVIFLDIQMPMESGLALAREISRLREPPLIVFVTAYSIHAVDAFEVHALDYLLKPLDDVRLAQAVQRSEAMLALRQREAYGEALRTYVDAAGAQYLDRINVRSVGRIEQVRVADILWIESAGNYVELHLDGRTVLHRIPLSRLETLLDPVDFVRVHRGALVRRDQVASLAVVGDGSYRLSLRCGAAVAVSERHVGAVRDCMA
jgi:two-component system LytT family response regulator